MRFQKALIDVHILYDITLSAYLFGLLICNLLENRQSDARNIILRVHPIYTFDVYHLKNQVSQILKQPTRAYL